MSALIGRRIRHGLIACVICMFGGCMASPLQEERTETPRAFTFRRGPLTVHSDFYLSPENRLIASLVDQRDNLRRWFGLRAVERSVDIHLFEDGCAFERFVAARHPEAPVRRAFFMDDGRRLAVYARWGLHGSEDLRHEVTHAYLHSAIPHIPLWIDEGIAEYYEAPPREHGVNRPLLERLCAARDAGRWSPDLRRLERMPPDRVMQQIEYAESWAWIHMLMESRTEYRQALRAYLRDLAAGPVTEPLCVRLRRIEGSPDQELLAHLDRLAKRIDRP